MAARKTQQRQSMIWAASKLFRRNGYSGTGLREILTASRAARGSLYHHFPGGKEEIGAATVTAAGSLVTEILTELSRQADSPADFLRRYADLLIRWLEGSKFQDGCPIALTLLETAPRSESIKVAGQVVFAQWQAVMANMLARHSWPSQKNAATVTLLIAGLEGALILAKVQCNAQPVRDTAKALCWILDEGLSGRT